MAESAIAIGIVVGLILGLTGAGGSVLAVPLLMAGLGWPLTQAVPVALLAVSAAAALGTWVAWRGGIVRYRAALLMALVGLLLAPLGLWTAEQLPSAQLALMFSALLAVVAVRMLHQAWQAPQETIVLQGSELHEAADSKPPTCQISTETGRIVWTQPCLWVVAATGAVTGFLSGLMGVGGGFVIVPALRAVTGLSIHAAVATSLMTIALTSLGTVGLSLLRGQAMPWDTALPFMLAALAGMAVGRWLAPRLAGPLLQQGFAVLMLLVAAGMLTHSVGGF